MTDRTDQRLSDGGSVGSGATPFEVGDWMRFLRSPAGAALEIDLAGAAPAGGDPHAAGTTFAGRSRLLGLRPGETKLVTFDGILGEVSMEPVPSCGEGRHLGGLDRHPYVVALDEPQVVEGGEGDLGHDGQRPADLYPGPFGPTVDRGDPA